MLESCMILLDVQNLHKSYGAKPALQGVNLTVGEGMVFGLLGPNGAGKTTLVKCALDLVPYPTGTILLDGKDAREPLSRRAVAYLPERFAFYPYYTVLGAAKFYASLHGLDNATFAARIGGVLQTLKLDSLVKQKIGTLSKGQLQRVGLSNLLLSDAKLLILDEPFSGLDPVGIRELKDLILKFREMGRSVLLNSHILSEVEQIADSVAILNEGRVLAQGPLATLRQEKSLEDFFFATLSKAEGAEK